MDYLHPSITSNLQHIYPSIHPPLYPIPHPPLYLSESPPAPSTSYHKRPPVHVPIHTSLYLTPHSTSIYLYPGDPQYTASRLMLEHLGLGAEVWGAAQHWQFCAGGLQGFVRGSDAERLVLQAVVNCSLTPECIAAPGTSRKNSNFDQTALTALIWHHGFSCLPRETHCMWSVKKVGEERVPTI